MPLTSRLCLRTPCLHSLVWSCQLFVCPSSTGSAYVGFELNSAGRALDFVATLTSPTSASLDFSRSFHARGSHAATSTLPPSYPFSHLYTLSVPWADLSFEAGADLDAVMQGVNARDMRVAILRGEVVQSEDGGGDAEPHAHTWCTAVDPDSADVTFHTTRVFRPLRLCKARPG